MQVCEHLDLRVGDALTCLSEMASESAQMCVTSPPYFGLRDYGVEGQAGLEATPEQYISGMVETFRELRRVLRDDGTLWLNIGDSYYSGKGESQGVDPKNPARRFGKRPQDARLPGRKPKDLIGIPWMLAFALRSDGWYLRQEIIWHKPNQMPQPAKDRCVVDHESVFLLSKSSRYYFDFEAIREPEICGRIRGPALHGDQKSTNGNAGLARRVSDGFRRKRGVWSINTQSFGGGHFATYPVALAQQCILAGSPAGAIVLDPFLGSGTTAVAAQNLKRSCIGIELNPSYAVMAIERNLDCGGL